MPNRLTTACWLCLLAIALAACGRLDAPRAGYYRAVIELKGGAVPVPLQISQQDGQFKLLLEDEPSTNAIQLNIQNGELHATLPNRAGELQARFYRKSLNGEWRLIDEQGKTTRFPFTAELNAHYRFIANSATDNADVSGYWQLNTSSQVGAHSLTAKQPVILNLKQTHDAVDGVLSLPDGEQLNMLGQVHGDDVYLSALGLSSLGLSSLGAGQVLLLRGKVTAQGELVGKLWVNLGDAQNWTAKHTLDQPTVDSTDDARQVAFPSAVPTP